MVCELKNNNNTPLCYIGIQGSPTCSIYWGKHKVNKYKTESMVPDLNGEKVEETYGVMTAVLDDMLKSYNLGFIGKDPTNSKLWYCLGYWANGILFGILGGMMLSKLYSGEVDKDINLFKVDRFDH